MYGGTIECVVFQGWHSCTALDMNRFYATHAASSLSSRERLSSLEPFDEFEEFALKCAHYVIALATSRDNTDFLTSVFPVEMQLVAECSLCCEPPFDPASEPEVVGRMQSRLLRREVITLESCVAHDRGYFGFCEQLQATQGASDRSEGEPAAAAPEAFGISSLNELLSSSEALQAAECSRFAHKCCVLSQLLFVVGGFGVSSRDADTQDSNRDSCRHRRVKELNCFNLQSPCWSRVDVTSSSNCIETRLDRMYHTVTAVDDVTFVVVGGRHSPHTGCSDVMIVSSQSDSASADAVAVNVESLKFPPDAPSARWRHTASCVQVKSTALSYFQIFTMID